MCKRELETEQRLQHIDPPTVLAITAFLSRSPGLLNRGPGDPSLCWDMVLISASFLQLIWTSCRRGYIIIWHPPTSCERHNSHSIQPLDSQGRPLISLAGCTCYLYKCISSFNSLAGVNMQQYLYVLANLSRVFFLIYSVIYEIFLCKRIYWATDETPIRTITPDQSGSGSNGNEKELHSTLISRT